MHSEVTGILRPNNGSQENTQAGSNCDTVACNGGQNSGRLCWQTQFARILLLDNCDNQIYFVTLSGNESKGVKTNG